MAEPKKPSQLDNELEIITGSEWLVVDNGTIVARMSINRIKSILNKNDVGLSNVDNTADSQKPVSGPQAAALSSKANISHTHPMSDVIGLATALTSKADVAHGHAITDVTNLADALSSKSPVGHTHVYSDVTGIDTAITNSVSALVPDLVTTAVGDQLANKSNVGHTHTTSDITNLAISINNAIAATIPTISANDIQNSMFVAELQW